MEIIISRLFKKQSQKLVENKPNLKRKINDCIIDYSKNFKKSKFYRKPLKWNWIGFDELEIWGNVRIIIKIRISEDATIFEQIWTHSQLFW